MLKGLNTHYSRNNFNKSKEPAFKNGAIARALGSPLLTGTFSYLEQNPAIEVAGIDALTMIVPRTAIDMKQNKVYGTETFFRETLPMLPNPFLPGIVAGTWMAAKGFKGLYADGSTIKNLHKAWNDSGGKNFPISATDSAGKRTQHNIVKRYIREVLLKTEGLAGRETKKLAEHDLNYLSARMAKAVTGNHGKKALSSEIGKIAEEFTHATGASGNLSVKIGDGISTSADMLVRDTVVTAKKVFTRTAPDKLNKVVDDLAKISKRRTFWGIASSIVLGASIQPMITKVSKMITGKDGFTGYKDFNEEAAQSVKDKNNPAKTESKPGKAGLFGKKLLAMAGMGGLMLATMGAFSKKGLFKPGGLKEFGKKLEIKDKFAHRDIVKLVYGGILMGRFGAARDESELKTSVARDYTGFLNWLVLGGVVSKGAAHLASKATGQEFIHVSGPIKDKNPLKTVKNWFGNVSSKTTAEIRTMTKGMSPAKKLMTHAMHNGTILAGLGYSMFALGIGVPMLINKYIINKGNKETPEKSAAEVAMKSGPAKDEGKQENIYSLSLNEAMKPVSFKTNSVVNKNGLYDNFVRRLYAKN